MWTSLRNESNVVANRNRQAVENLGHAQLRMDSFFLFLHEGRRSSWEFFFLDELVRFDLPHVERVIVQSALLHGPSLITRSSIRRF